ncbi:MAG: acetylxylan esterase [Candidatus Sulfotelmatobacter sp.]
MQFWRSRILRSFIQESIVSKPILLGFSFALINLAVAFAQHAPVPVPSSSGAKASQQTPPATPAATTAADGTVPGLDMKSGIPLYETIQEDWSSLQIGASKLEPMPPMVGGVDEQQTFTRIMTRVQWRPGDPIDLWIFLPKGVTKPPVVLYLYDGKDARFRDNSWAQRVTAGGVAAVAFVPALTGPRFHDRPMKQWFVSELQEALGSTVHDVRFILDYLASSGKVDMSRVGMFGEGRGGTIAILAAAADPRIKAVDALDPWGDWPDFLAKSPVIEPDPAHADYVKPEFLKKVAPLDPVKWLPELKIPVRIQQIHDNDTTPVECKEAIKAAAPKQAEVLRFAALTDLGTREGGGRLYEWIKDRLRESPKASTGTDAKVAVVDKAVGKPAAAEMQ